jgi:hypothetical protein
MAVLLLVIGLGLAIANVWFTAARSTIPLDLNGMVTSMELRREKHPGRDDVFLLKLHSSPEFQVDEVVYRAIDIGERLRKPRWSRRLVHDTETLNLTWSRDCRGMMTAMPLFVLILLATCLATCWQRRRPTAGS